MKKHQHFIPRVYLKNFKNSKQSELINTFNKNTGKYQENLSITNICVEKDFYTLKHLKPEDKLALEEYFDIEIESKYEKVYNLLTKEKPNQITIDQKLEILNTTLSMYFRTPKILNQFLEKIDGFIQRLIDNKDVNEIEFHGVKIQIDGKTKDEIKKKIREHLKTGYLAIQLNLFKKFVNFKITDGITVIENSSGFDFLTGDNPVNFLNGEGNNEDIFNVNNSIYIPLDPKHCLFIAAPKLPKSTTEIFYQNDNQFLTLAVNSCTFDNAERWIVGHGENFKKTLENYFELNSIYDREHPMLKSLAKKVELLSSVFMEIKKNGISTENIGLINTLTEIKNWSEYENHVDLVDLVNKVEKDILNL